MSEHLHEPPAPGQDCPRCHRRVPHPRKPDSPRSKVVSFRVPDGEAEAFDQLLDAATRYLAARGRPFDRFWTQQFALVALLQTAEFEGALGRLSD